jgi:hypothetical protein
MIIILSNGKQLRGDLILSAIIRSDLAPIPATFEAEIRIDESLKKLLEEGKTITAEGDLFYIIKAEILTGRHSQGQHDMRHVKITCLLDACHTIAFTRERPIIKENSTLVEIYKAAGATLRAIDADFPVPRFNCLRGGTPSFPIAQILQEEGGVVRWKDGKMKFFRLPDLLKQKPVMKIPYNAQDNVNSGFLERHEVPWFYSLKDDGTFVYGNQTKSRTVLYTPFKNTQRLQNMTRCLVQRKISKVKYLSKLCAGDLIDIIGSKPLVIVTVAHVLMGGTDSSPAEQYTRLWLSSVEE